MSASEQSHRRPPGRPRSVRATEAVLAAAARLLAEGGLGAMTMEDVAREAGVSKATLYRWWPSKGVLALEVLLRADTADLTPPDTGDVRADLTAHLRSVVSRFRDSDDGRAIADLLAQAQHDPVVAEAFRDRWLASRRAAGRQRLTTAQRAGQLRHDVDLEVVMDALYAPIYLRLFAGHGSLDDRLADRLADIVLAGTARCGPDPADSPSRL